MKNYVCALSWILGYGIFRLLRRDDASGLSDET
jgi:hypothetical protein